MPTRLAAIALLAATALANSTIAAQGRPVTVRGIAYDSLRGSPLPGAMISVMGTGRSTVSDPRGRFEVDSVPPGSYTILMSHDALDSLGLTGVSTKATVTDGRGEVRIAVPSFTSFWNAGCTGKAPRDSSLVYGIVRKPGSGAPVPGAKVELAWLDVGVEKKRDVQQRSKRLETTADSVGNYGFCGVPNGVGFRVRASTDSASSGIIDVMPDDVRVRWRDLSVGPTATPGRTLTGTVRGQVMRGTGQPFPDVRIVMDDAPETRTDSAGRFTLANVPTGTRQLQALAVGQDVQTRSFDVAPGDTARVVINVDRIATLGSVRITGTPFTRRLIENIDERRARSAGTFVDSLDFRGAHLMRTALSAIPSVKMGGSGRTPIVTMRAGQCTPTVFIDGVDQRGQETLWNVYPEEVALMEVYASRAVLPTEFQGPRRADCAIVVWTKRAIGR